jgi:hypothetical protein
LQLHVICSHLWLSLGIFTIVKSNFNYFGHSYNYDATIKNFILSIRGLLSLFSSINRLICPINQNIHQISCILKVFYNDTGVYFYVCIIIIFMICYIYHKYIYICVYINYAYVCILFILMNLKIHIWSLKYAFFKCKLYSKIYVWV